MRDLSTFAALILTHGRPEKVVTYRTLRRLGYTGRIVLVVDDEDPTLQGYLRKFPGEVEVFSKEEVAQHFDEGDQGGDRRTIVYARNAAFSIARGLGLTHFVQLDDDYSAFSYRRPGRSDTTVHSLDALFGLMLDVLEDTGAVTVAFSQGGDSIGGKASRINRAGWKRKAMNSFFVRTDRPVQFVGRLNEDVNAYCLQGSRGDLFLTLPQVYLTQNATQSSAGGMTEAYLAVGTYTKSFYTVMMCPSFVDIRSMGQTDRRLHHRVDWAHAVPRILGPEHRKAA